MFRNSATVAAGSLWTLSSVLYLSSSTFHSDFYVASWLLCLSVIGACCFCFTAALSGSRVLRLAATGVHLSVPLAWVACYATFAGEGISVEACAAFAFAAFTGTVVADLGVYLDAEEVSAVPASPARAAVSSLLHTGHLAARESGGFQVLAARESGGFQVLTAADSGSFRMR